MNGNPITDAEPDADSGQRPKRKPWWRYWLARIYLALNLVAPIFFVTAFALEWGNMTVYLLLWFPVLATHAFYLAMSLSVFPFKYSVFGPYERAPVPKGRPLWSGESSCRVGGIRICDMARPFAGFGKLPPYIGLWRVYPSGIAFPLTGLGTALIHREQIVELEPGHKGRYTLRHTCPELAKTVSFSNEKLIQAVLGIIPK